MEEVEGICHGKHRGLLPPGPIPNPSNSHVTVYFLIFKRQQIYKVKLWWHVTCRVILRCFLCVTPEEAKHSPGETPAFTFIWSELQSPPHLWKMSLRSQRFHVSFSEFIRERVDFWICLLLFMQSEKSCLAKPWEIQALCNTGNKKTQNNVSLN